uniref:C2 domain-containing protein n=1 Tax=Crocodylus porosus TaxID=8502 RepID=A0A7M4DUI4_CROPO
MTAMFPSSRDLGSVTVPLAFLATKPSHVLTLKDLPLLDNDRQPMGVSLGVTRLDKGRFFHWDCSFEATGPGGVRRGLTSDKPSVRVKVIEARQLQGNNIRPVVKVFIGEHMFHTRIKTGNSPYFNEVFLQSFRKTPARLFDETITIQHGWVILGANFDLFFLPPEPGHALNCKWLSLYHPDHLGTGLRGYLQVSICVLGAGDPAPSWDSASQFPDTVSSRAAPTQPWHPLEQAMSSSELGPLLTCCLIHPCRDQPEALGTAAIRLSQVSSAGTEAEGDFAGFLPCFGPSFLTLNKCLGDLPNQPDTQEAHKAGSVKAGAGGLCCLGTPAHLSMAHGRKYGLGAIFYSATMLPQLTGLLRLQVSMGHYGDNAEHSCKPVPSSTPYSQAVYDGNHYHYLPWYDTKPAAAVTSFWENVGYRLDALNALQATHDRLGPLLQGSGSPNPPLALCFCRKPLPDLEGRVTATILDHRLREQRVWLLRRVARCAEKLHAEALVAQAQDWLQQLAAVAHEPQASIPDVMIWLLCGEQRVAYARVPAHAVLFSKAGPRTCGRLCGKTHTLFLKGQLRVRLWLGLVTNSEAFKRCCEGRVQVYAETVREA